MTTLDRLLYQAGGYSAKDLTNASDEERRQILQLGCAVIFSVIASVISWGFAATLLPITGIDSLTKSQTLLLTSLVVLPIFISFNRNLIFYSDTHEEQMLSYSYSGAKKGRSHTLPYLRVVLVLIVSGLNIQVFTPGLGLFLIVLLGVFELYPIFLKKQMGQTIIGRRMKAKLDYQHQRGNLKMAEYEMLLEQQGRKIKEDLDPDPFDPAPYTHSAPAPERKVAPHESIRLVT